MDLMSLRPHKARQAMGILDELNLDAWLIAVRETPVMADPILDLVIGLEATWQSFFLFSRSGQAIALVGNFDQDDYVRSAIFDEVLTYTEDPRDALTGMLDRFHPRHLAINYAEDDASADGLTHGMYLRLLHYLSDTPYPDRLTSASELCRKLRGRKLPEEVESLRQAAVAATEVWEAVVPRLEPGMTERRIAAMIDGAIREAGGEPSFQTIVNAGAKTDPGHGSPTEAILERGDLLHVDFGVRLDGYCSDIQRLLWLSPNENGVPDELSRAFGCVRDIITASAKRCVPGSVGHEIDTAARQSLEARGYEAYQHALGHQLGRAVHDGGAIIGPRWSRYGRSSVEPIEESNVFTLELEILLPGIGCVGLEEDVVVTPTGADFLCSRQMELIVR